MDMESKLRAGSSSRRPKVKSYCTVNVVEFLWLSMISMTPGKISRVDYFHLSSCEISRFFECWPITLISVHDDVIKWKHFPRYWPFVRGIHRSPVNFPHKGQWHTALMFSLICAWINDWVNKGEAGYLRRHRAHYDVTVIYSVEAVHA